jgi:methylthioribose-1-phosphate isomerase
MAGYFMSKGEIDAVIVGADRISLNGDTANKIGTLGLSIMAKYYSIPFYIAAPISTIDTSIESGKYIPIEQRGENEVREVMGTKIIPEYMPVKNPAFDVAPCGNITAIITEKGVIEPPFKENIKKIVTSADNTDKETGADKR